MRTETVRESMPAVLALSDVEATTLAVVGRRLASQATWWGTTEDDGDAADRSVVRVRRAGARQWEIRVSDAVGVVVAGELALFVLPKIPVDHLLYLLDQSGDFPRVDTDSVTLASAASLWELVAHAFVSAAERLLRLGLVRDYEETRATLDAASGRIEPLATAAHYYSGRLALECVFDDFSFDTPLNRTILAAARIVADNELLPASLRLRAIRAAGQMTDIGPPRPSDVTAELDRRTAHYESSFRLAGHIIRHVGRHLVEGKTPAWSFLIRTPEMVERGLLAILQRRLGATRVKKGHKQLPGTTVTFNPDLVFDDGRAVGDVKYKLSAGDWDRPDLYQAISFAEAYRADRSVIVRFRAPTAKPVPDLVVGMKRVREVTWDADASLPPTVAAARVADDVAVWLGGSDAALLR